MATASSPREIANIKGCTPSGPPGLQASAPQTTICRTESSSPPASNKCKGVHERAALSSSAATEGPETREGPEKRASSAATSFEPSMWAPARKSWSMTSTLPRCAARCKGLQPRLSLRVGQARRVRSVLTNPKLWRCTASCKEDAPLESWASTCVSGQAQRASTMSWCPSRTAVSKGGLVPDTPFTHARLCRSVCTTSAAPASTANATQRSGLAAASPHSSQGAPSFNNILTLARRPA
mmetsp:Transcript_110936/g.237046  ORF Transcript_110936/g.237046 Transcript_110936/m.237046 type:complete len:238 (+) Transcript_110936:591-1304(+)